MKLNDKQIKKIEKEIRGIYNSWHQCALKTDGDAPGVKAGRLCDICEDHVASATNRIKEIVNINTE